jgi:hypothetical protein
MDQIVKPQIKYEVRGDFLYVDNHRYKIDTITSVRIKKTGYFLGHWYGNSGADACSLCINGSEHPLNFHILDKDSEEVNVAKHQLLKELVADIKRLINW